MINMNRKKILTSFLVLLGALIISTCTNTVQAADYNLGITKDRSEEVIKPGYPKYQYLYMDDINIWKIVNYPKAGDVNDQIEYSSDKTIYCLEHGLGFAGEGELQTGIDHSTVAKKYSNEINLKDPNALATLQALYPNNKVFDSTSKEYKALLWLIDNAYIPGESDKNEFLKKIPYDEEHSILDIMEETKKNDVEYKANDDITDSDIDMLQQLAIWHYTNGDKEAFESNTLKTIRLNYKANETAEAKEGSYNDIFRVETEDDDIDYGIYRFEYLKKLYEYLIAEANKAAENGYAGDDKTIATVVIATENAQNEQPVVVITRKQRILDLALRKFITEKNGEKITDRIPQVNIQKLVNGEDSTAIYNHPKASIKVEEGDVITYTIRIYNEGNVNAKVLEIKDYIPAGLTYEPYNNQDVTWLANTEEGTCTTTDFCKITNFTENEEARAKFLNINGVENEEKLKEKYLNEIIIPAFDGKVLNYVDIEIKCKVTESKAKTLTSVAEISSSITEDGLISKDSDSTGNNIEKIDVAKQSAYTGGKNDRKACYDGTNIINGTYFQGQEDDDDFEKIEVKQKELDLALRKFISGVNNKTSEESRDPKVDVTKLKTGESTNATYNHSKEALSVETNDIITYTLRVYNEGELSGYAEEITDNIPEGLEFIIDSEKNKEYGWVMRDENGVITDKLENAKYLTTDYLSKENEKTAGGNLILAYAKGDELNYKEVQIQFKLISSAAGKSIINIAQISKEADDEGNNIEKDRDSKPSREDPYDFEDKTKNEDDIDIEVVKIKQFDLALKKFITEVNGTKIANRVPTVDVTKLVSGDAKDATYTMPKTPVEVETDAIITYTIRVYNEGNISGYAREITDNIPEGLEYIANSVVNQKYGWKMLDSEGKETSENAKYLTTDYLSKEKNEENLIKAFDGEKLDYKDVEIQFRVTYKVTKDAEKGKELINEAQISSAINESGNEEIKDRDSNPSKDEKYNFEDKTKNEDDIDYEKTVVRYFDLSLKKFVSAVNGTPVNNRAPEVKYEDEKLKFTMKKEPVDVTKGDTIYYTIRVYNEGDLSGYAYEITDNIPEGLQFLVDDEVNKKYGWKMLDSEEKETENLEDAKYLVTDYLKNTKIAGFDRTKEVTETNPSYADVQIAFKVTYDEKTKDSTERTLINIAQISKDSHNDIDSEPTRKDVYNFEDESKNEDDIDYEKVKVKYFDLALLKWVSKTIVTVNGETEEKETGNSGLPTDIMPKVEIKSKEIDKVTVKFEYVIKVTNEGQIPGYALKIKDYIPEGLKFEKEDNPDWYEVEDEEGTIETDKIALELLQPGDSREVKVILTWINGTENFGEKINFAEISKDYNESETPDADSTPNNKVKEEDDIDKASVILSVKTGQGRIYYILGATIILTIAGGTILIKKYVL